MLLHHSTKSCNYILFCIYNYLLFLISYMFRRAIYMMSYQYKYFLHLHHTKHVKQDLDQNFDIHEHISNQLNLLIDNTLKQNYISLYINLCLLILSYKFQHLFHLHHILFNQSISYLSQNSILYQCHNLMYILMLLFHILICNFSHLYGNNN